MILGPAPNFTAIPALGPGEADVRDVSLGDYAGRWLVLFFYPRDFTPVCPTEVKELSRRARELSDLGAEILGVSVDDVRRTGGGSPRCSGRSRSRSPPIPRAR